jgi:hypothetical protein
LSCKAQQQLTNRCSLGATAHDFNVQEIAALLIHEIRYWFRAIHVHVSKYNLVSSLPGTTHSEVEPVVRVVGIKYTALPMDGTKPVSYLMDQ